MDCFGTYLTHAQTCNVPRVQSATEWTALVHSVHTPHMPKPNVTRVQSATEWTASVHSARCWPAMCKARVIRNFHVKHNKFEFAKKLPDVKRPKRGVVAGTACGLLWTSSFRLNFETNQEKEARWMIKFSLTSICLGLELPLARKRKLQSGIGQNLLTKFVAGRAKKRGRQ